MNAFLLIVCFSMIAAAAPNGGYNYQQSRHSANQINQQLHHPTILTKTIYLHSAPDETDVYHHSSGGEPEPVHKNYRVLFIKAPTHNVRFNLHQHIKPQNEEKTAIYVLSKKPDITTIQSQVIQPEQKPHKPEVHFIKYKTQAEAIRAQQEIRAQYEALGGATIISDEGIAPITSVSGGGSFSSGSLNDPSLSSGSNLVQSISNNLHHSFAGSQGLGSSPSFGVAAPNIEYLPAKVKKL